jgi:hypothetical protein
MPFMKEKAVRKQKMKGAALSRPQNAVLPELLCRLSHIVWLQHQGDTPELIGAEPMFHILIK